MENPICPQCGGKFHKKGKTPAGYQRWRCFSCGYQFSDSPTPRSTKAQFIRCPYCGSENNWSKGRDRRLCLGCGKSWKIA